MEKSAPSHWVGVLPPHPLQIERMPILTRKKVLQATQAGVHTQIEGALFEKGHI